MVRGDKLASSRAMYNSSFIFFISMNFRCGFGSYCSLFEEGDNETECDCGLSEGLYETEVEAGTGCNLLRDHCRGLPCRNGGTCLPTFGSFNCICTEQFYGQACHLVKNVSGIVRTAKNLMAFFDAHEQESAGKITFHVVAEDLGEQFSLLIDDGNGFRRTESDISFSQDDPYSLCRRHLASHSSADLNICQTFVPRGLMYVGKAELKYPVVKESERLVKRGRNSSIIGRLDKVYLAARNAHLQVFSNTYLVYTYYTRRSAACTLAVHLKHCSMDIERPVAYGRSSMILLSAVTAPLFREHPCTLVTSLSHSWRVSGKGVDKKYEGLEVLRLNGMDLDFGTYTVEYTVDVFGSPDLGVEKKHYPNFGRCWFKVDPQSVVGLISGGLVRTKVKETAVLMNGSLSWDPNYPSSSRMSYRWSCSNTKSKFCTEYSDSTRSKSFVIRNLKRTIDFRLVVYNRDLGREYAGETVQTIRILDSGDIIDGFEISCKRNCLYTNVNEMTVLELNDYPRKGKVNWTYAEGDRAYEPIERISQAGSPVYRVIIDSRALEPAKEYRIRATYGDNLTIYKIKTSPLPKDGNCTVSPSSGEAGYTDFTVDCREFEPHSTSAAPLVYEVYEEHQLFPDVLLASSRANVIPNLRFSTEKLKIKILDRIGSSVEQHLAVKLEDSGVLSSSAVEGFLRMMSAYLVGNDSPRALSVVNYIGSALPRVEEQELVVDSLVSRLLEVKLYEAADTKAVLGSLGYLLSRTSGTNLSSQTVRKASALLRRLTSAIKSASIDVRTFQNDDIIIIANFVLGAMDPSLSSRDPRFVSKENSTPVQYERSYADYRLGSADMLASLEEMGDIVLSTMSPYQRPYKINRSEDVIMETKVVPGEDLAGVRIDPSGEGKAWLGFSQQLGADYSGATLEIQVTEFRKHPLWWKETDLPLNTHDLNVKIGIREGNSTTALPKLVSPFQIFLEVTDVPSKEISGGVVQPAPYLSAAEKDLYVAIHKIDRPKKGFGLIAFNFTNLEQQQFDVVMLVNEIPDYDSVRGRGARVNSTHPLYLKRITMDMEEEDIFYFGLLPASKHPPGEDLKYTLDVLDSLCRVWTHQSWDIGLCEVSTGKKKGIVCECRHLSLFGGSLLVPPIIVHPIRDVTLFKTVHSNPYVLMLVSLFLVLYLGLFLWADKMDRKDTRERRIIQLQDNFPGDKFGYLLAVFTSERANSGTSANVGVRLIGSRGESHPHILNHDKNLLQLGQDNWFLIYTETHLGKISQLHVWHDNTGPHPDWFCFKIMVYDLASEEQYLFPVGQWLSINTVKTDDWKLEMKLDPTPEAPGWQYLAKENFFAGLRESHIWFSIFVRHPRSSYTRRQRLTIGLIIILISMLSSIMFYGAAEDVPEDNPSYNIGAREIVIAVQATLIAVVVSVVAAKLFTLSWPQQVIQAPPTVNVEPKIQSPWYTSTTIKKRLSSARESIGKLILGFLIMDPLLPVQLNPEQPLVSEKKKKKRTVFLIIAWIVNISIIVTCSYFLVLYGLTFGPNKSIVWASVVLFNIGKAIFLTQPLKIIILSLLVAVFLKMENRDQMTFEVDPEGVDEKLKNDPEFMTELLELRSQSMYHPLTQIDVMVAYQTRKKTEKSKWDNINFVFVSIIYVFLIIIVVTLSTHTSPQHVQHIMEMIQEHGDRNSTGLSDVYTNTKLVEYLVETLIPSLHQKRWYNNDPLPREKEEEGEEEQHIKGWALDYVNKLLCVPRLRQLRITDDTCAVVHYFSDWFESCNQSLSKANIDRHSYGMSWTQRKPYIWNYSNPWSSETLNLYGASGYYYPGGGYIQNLTHNSWDSIRKLVNLNLTGWLDERTRLTVFELNLFNVHSSLFSVVTLVAENLASGVYTTRMYVDSAYHEFYMEDLDVKLVTVLCFLVIILILSIIRIVIHVSVKGMAAYFRNWGHMVDFLIIFFGFTSIIAAIIRSMYFKTYSDIFNDAGKDIFVSFHYPFYQDDLTAILISLFVIFTGIRLCWLCQYGRYCYVMRKALAESIGYVLVVVLLTILVVSLLAALMYSCGTQTFLIFPALPVPRIRFKQFEKHTRLQAESMLFSICLNIIYLFSGINMVCIFIYFYGKAKHHLEWYGYGSDYTNRFLDLYRSLVEELKSILGSVKGDKALRLKGGSSSARELLFEGSAYWEIKRRRRRNIGEWGGFRHAENCRRTSGDQSSHDTPQQMTEWIRRTTARHEKMCRQLDMVSEILEKQSVPKFYNV